MELVRAGLARPVWQRSVVDTDDGVTLLEERKGRQYGSR